MIINCNAVERSCSELTSDTKLYNHSGQDVHKALGFIGMECVIFSQMVIVFVKNLLLQGLLLS
jgi:hypothetical protein